MVQPDTACGSAAHSVARASSSACRACGDRGSRFFAFRMFGRCLGRQDANRPHQGRHRLAEVTGRH